MPFYLIAVLGSAFVALLAANVKHRSQRQTGQWGFLTCSVLFIGQAINQTIIGASPYVWVVTGISASLLLLFSRSTPKANEESEGSRTCPWCAELIKKDAKVCKHCGREISPATQNRASSSQHHLPYKDL